MECSTSVVEPPSTTNSLTIVTTLEKLNAAAAISVYKRLSNDEIRLVKIHPGEIGDPIQCSLFTISENQIPEYEALSYVCKETRRFTFGC
jgi:hypothetical protein